MYTRPIAALLILYMVSAAVGSLGGPPKLWAQEPIAMSSEAVRIPATTVHTIPSSNVERDLQLWIAEPVAGLQPLPTGPRDVLWVLDANLFFGTAVEMTRIMSQLYAELPPLLVVGVGYATDSPIVQSDLRTRDLTPSSDPQLEGMMEAMAAGRELTLPEGERMGGADRLLAFLEEEAAPFLLQRHPDATGRSVLFGSSLGGLFALHALMERPNLFDGWIVASPSIWWDGNSLLDRVAALPHHALSDGGTVFLAVGGEEERNDIPMLSRFKMVSNLHEMAHRLEGHVSDGLRVTTHVAEGETHTSVVPVALTWGLRAILRR